LLILYKIFLINKINLVSEIKKGNTQVLAKVQMIQVPVIWIRAQVKALHQVIKVEKEKKLKDIDNIHIYI